MAYPLELTLADVQLKAVHNSYGTGKRTIAQQVTWNPGKPYRGGCCGIELDVVQKPGAWEWSVQHGGEYTGSKSVQLAHYLGQLNDWSAAQRRDHAPIFVHVDLKDSQGSHADFADEFDGYVREAMPDATFFGPAELLGGEATLLDAALAYGWPTVAEAWGQFIVCLSGGQRQRTDVYLQTNLFGRLCFADRDVNATILAGNVDPRAEPNRVIYNLRYDKLGALQRLIDPQYRRALIFRVYEVNDEETWQRAQKLGANLLATDQLFVTRWALASRECPLCPIGG